MGVKVGDFVIDKHDKKKKKVMGISGSLYFIGADREPVRINEINDKMKKKTTKTIAKRGLTAAEMKAENAKRQAYVGYLNKLKNNEQISSEMRAILKRMHKAALDVVNLSGLLFIENSKY